MAATCLSGPTIYAIRKNQDDSPSAHVLTALADGLRLLDPENVLDGIAGWREAFSDDELAGVLGVDEQEAHRYRIGKRTWSPERRALLMGAMRAMRIDMRSRHIL